MKRTTFICLLFVLSIFLPYPVDAARTNIWEFEEIKTWLQGDFEGSGLTSDGTVLPTISTNSTSLPARIVWESATLDDSTIVGTSFPSAIYRIHPNSEPEILLKTNDLGFTALGRIGGSIYAASSPSGNLYRYDTSRDSMVKVNSLSDSYVWTMTTDEDGSHLYLGTGPNGNLYTLTENGDLEKTTTIPGNNIMSTTIYNGNLHLGSDAGGVYQVTDKNEVESVYGFSGGEVSSLTSNNSYLFAAVNKRKGSDLDKKKERQSSNLANQLKQEALEKQAEEGFGSFTEETDVNDELNQQAQPMMIQQIREQNQKKSSGLFAGLSGTLVYRLKPPEQMNVIYNDDQEIVLDMGTSEDNLFVSTGGRGRLYKVTPDFTRIAYFKADQSLVTDFRLQNDEVETITTGEAGAVYQREQFNSSDVTYRSQPLDAQLLSQWGLMETLGNEQYQVRTRSGNTDQPDTQWTNWSSWKNPPKIEISSSSARFLQFQVKFLEPSAKLKKIDIAFQIPNQRPRIADISVSSNPIKSRFIQSRETSENGNSKQRHQSNSQQKMNNSSVKSRQITWNIIDPDGDPIQSKLFYKPLDGEQWISFTGEDFIKENKYEMDLRKLSDGYYRLKLVSTDRFFNDPKYGFTTEKKTAPILVDNTQPNFESLSVTKSSIQFTASDKTSRIMLAQYRINGGRWHTLWPTDDIFDEEREQFSFKLPSTVESDDQVELRLIDEGGNQALTRRSIP